MRRLSPVLTAAAAVGLLTLALLGVANSVAGPTMCSVPANAVPASSFDDTYCENPGPSLGMSMMVSAAVATATGMYRWSKLKRDGDKSRAATRA